MTHLLTHTDIINFLRAEKSFLKSEFGVVNIGLFGSFVKGHQKEDSDIDLLVDFEQPRFDWLAGLQLYLEEKFDRNIEIVRKSVKINRRFTQRVENEVIYA